MGKKPNIVLATLVLFLSSTSPSRSLPQDESGSLIPIIAESDLIVVGEVVSKEAKWGEGKGLIYTHITITVEEYIKGSSPSNEIVLRYLGGTIGNRETKVSLPRPLFNIKEKVIVMLRLLPDQKHYILADREGKLSIDPRRGKVIGPETSKQEFVRMIKDIVASQKK